jgi:hypothetical protein
MSGKRDEPVRVVAVVMAEDHVLERTELFSIESH